MSDQIQRCTGIPMPYLRKILFIMGKAGLIETKRGRHGGFVLARPADQITLMDVAAAMGKHDPLPECLLELPGCSDATPCPMRSFWQKERARIEKKLEGVTVAEAASAVVSARWGRLTCCPTSEELVEPNPPKRASRRKPAKASKPQAQKDKPRSRGQ